MQLTHKTMKHILLFNDKLHAGKDELLQTIVNGLKVHFVNVISISAINSVENQILVDSKANISAIFFQNVFNYDYVLRFAFRQTLDILRNGNLIQTVHTPQLVFVCDFAKDQMPEAHLEKFHIISIE